MYLCKQLWGIQCFFRHGPKVILPNFNIPKFWGINWARPFLWELQHHFHMTPFILFFTLPCWYSAQWHFHCLLIHLMMYSDLMKYCYQICSFEEVSALFWETIIKYFRHDWLIFSFQDMKVSKLYTKWWRYG